MFHMSRNGKKSETRAVAQALADLGRRLPPGWAIARRSTRSGAPAGAPIDCIAVLTAPDGAAGQIAIQAKQKVDPRDVRQLAERLGSVPPAVPVVVAPFLSSRARELLTEAGIGYLDRTGNARIVVQRPALFVRTSGADRDPAPKTRAVSLRTLRGPGTGRAVRALCDFRPPYGVRELGVRSKASAPTLSRVIDLLEREALLERAPGGSVARVDVPGVIRRWVEDYGFATSNRVATYLDPHGLEHLRRRLSESKDRLMYVVTGSLAGASIVSVAPPRLVQVFVDDAESAATGLGLREADAGANVVLAEPYDDVVFERTTTRDGIACAAAPQVVADLLTSPGRGPAEADALLAWMAKNEPRWRS
jgi:hypothetical protein